MADLFQRLFSIADGRFSDGSRPPPMVRGPDVGEAPLTQFQELRWQRLRGDPGNRHFQFGSAVRLDGPLDLTALEGALQQAFARHEVLRTTILLDRPVAQIAEPSAVPLPVEDLRGLDERAQERRAVDAVLRPLDTSKGALRPQLLRVADDGHLLLLAFQNMLLNQVTIGQLLSELGADYGAQIAGRPSTVATPRLQFSDFARWQRALPEIDRRVAAWRESAAGCGPICLPLDHPRGATPGAMRLHEFRIAAELAAAILDGSRRLSCTPFMLLASAFVLLLHHRTTLSRLAVKTSARITLRAAHRTLGLFYTWILLLSGELSADLTLADLLERTIEAQLRAQEDQNVPQWEALPDETRAVHDVLLDPLVPGEQALAWPGLTARPVGLPLLAEYRARFDLVFLCGLKDFEHQYLALLYDSSLFSDAAMERFARDYRCALEELIARPRQRVATLCATLDRRR